jgi:succinate dehydrogenase (ubiquinone) membrane anchor subunit
VNVQSLVEADSGAVGTKFYHLSNTALLVAAPLALFLSPSPLTFPVDLFLGVAFPVHGHIGINYIISDYVPRASRPLARYVLLGATTVTLLGLLKLNLSGPGLTETFKSLWRAEKKEEA